VASAAGPAVSQVGVQVGSAGVVGSAGGTASVAVAVPAAGSVPGTQVAGGGGVVVTGGVGVAVVGGAVVGGAVLGVVVLGVVVLGVVVLGVVVLGVVVLGVVVLGVVGVVGSVDLEASASGPSVLSLGVAGVGTPAAAGVSPETAGVPGGASSVGPRTGAASSSRATAD
jgi:hypothetical protein